MNSLVKSLLPPLLVEMIRGRRKLYPTWEAARAAAGSYDDEALNRFRLERSALYSSDGAVLRASALNLVALALKSDTLHVTDFGGSAGELGVDFLAAFPKATYTVVETPTLVAMTGPEYRGVKFASAMRDACDVFVTGGTIQFLHNPLDIVAAGFASAGTAVILTRNSFCEREMFRVQKTRLFNNGAGPIPPGYRNAKISYPNRTISEKAIYGIASDHGFRCAMSTGEASGVISYGSDVYGRDLVFLRPHIFTPMDLHLPHSHANADV